MAEANDFRTTLRFAITANATSLTLTSVTGTGINAAPAVPFRIRIGNELLLVTARAGLVCTVTRGIESSVAAAHTAGAVVRQVLTVAGLSELFADESGAFGPDASTDNAIVRWDGADGSTLQDSQPIVEDDGRISAITDPVGDQDAATKGYVDALVAAAGSGGGDIAQNSFLVSGGQVVWVEDYVFLVSAATYYIGGVLYQSPQTEVTLDAADPSDDRIDVVAVNDSGLVEVIDGTPAAQPSTPDVDPGSQLQLAIILVTANTTEPADNDSEEVYDETGGAEWTPSTSGAGWTTGATATPYHGLTHIDAANIAANSYVQFTIPAAYLDPAEWDNLTFYIQPKASWPNNRTLVVTLRTSTGAQLGNAVTVTNGVFGFQSGTIAYQQISIPMATFAIAPGSAVAIVRVTKQGPGTIGFLLDYFRFLAGAVSQNPVGITQDQADARYLRRSLNLADVSDAATARANIGAGTGSGNVAGPAGGVSVDKEIALFDGTTGTVLERATGTGIVRVSSGVYGTPGNVDLTSEVTGDLPLSNLAQSSAASKLLGRGSASGAGDFEELTIGGGLSMSGTTLSAASSIATRTIVANIGNGIDVITTGTKGYLPACPFAGTITKVTLHAKESGSVVIDVWKDTYANAPPTDTDSITASAPPTISLDQKSEDSTLTGWTTSVSIGDVFGFNVDSATTITQVTLVLTVSVS